MENRKIVRTKEDDVIRVMIILLIITIRANVTKIFDEKFSELLIYNIKREIFLINMTDKNVYKSFYPKSTSGQIDCVDLHAHKRFHENA